MEMYIYEVSVIIVTQQKLKKKNLDWTERKYRFKFQYGL